MRARASGNASPLASRMRLSAAPKSASTRDLEVDGIEGPPVALALDVGDERTRLAVVRRVGRDVRERVARAVHLVLHAVRGADGRVELPRRREAHHLAPRVGVRAARAVARLPRAAGDGHEAVAVELARD